VTIRGLGFTGATVSTPSASLTLQNATVVNDETITVDVVVAPGTNVDSLHTITVTRNLATSSATFQVIGDEKPFIGAVRPPFGNRGATFAIILEGVNLGTVVQGTGVVINGSKVSVTNATALDAFTVRAIVSLTDTAAAGNRDVIVTTDGGTFSKDQSFRVNIPGQVPTITNVTPTHVDPGTTTPITVTGAGLAGAGVTVGGAGATVSNIVADPLGATVTFDLTLTEDAPAESRPLLVVTENGIAQCNISSGADIQLVPAQLLQTGSEFRVTSIGFRLFLFEFSINSNFDQGLRTYGVANATGTLTISNLDALNVARAVRDLPFGYVRVLAVTATNQVGMSDVFRFRR
jgi:hypothetical protein